MTRLMLIPVVSWRYPDGDPLPPDLQQGRQLGLAMG